MPLLDRPIRLLLTVTFGLLPVLCCCGEAVATAERTAISAAAPETADPHACCEASPEGDPAPAEAPGDPASHGCGCGTHLNVMPDARPDATAVAATTPADLPCCWLAPLPRPLATVLTDPAALTAPPPACDAAALPAAPTLRALGVLLLT